MQRILTYRLFENPDRVIYDEPREIRSTFWDEDGVAFGYLDDEMMISLGGKHFDFIPTKDTDDDEDEYDSRYVTSTGSIIRENIKFAGRLWLETKVISFWIYPSKEELKDVLNDVKEAFDKRFPNYKLKMDFSDPDWLIEVIGDFEDPGDADWDKEILGNKKPKLVPLSEYTGSMARDEEDIRMPHLMDWREKEMLKKKGVIFGKGFGSDMTAWDSKNPLVWRQAKYQESMKVKFSEFLNEDKIETEYTIYCDMDGVLSDFDGDFKRKYLDEFNEENGTDFETGWDYEEVYGSKEFWREIKKLGLQFWSDMNWMKDGKKLWNFLKKYDPKILTKPSADELSKKGKIIWCKREIDMKPILAFRKETYVKNDKCILIDDLKKNIDAWVKKGGIGILHKNADDTIKKLKEILGE